MAYHLISQLDANSYNRKLFYIDHDDVSECPVVTRQKVNQIAIGSQCIPITDFSLVYTLSSDLEWVRSRSAAVIPTVLTSPNNTIDIGGGEFNVTVDVNLSEEEGQILEVREDGVYVTAIQKKDVIDELKSHTMDLPLSANMGRELNESIISVNTTLTQSIEALSETLNESVETLEESIATKVDIHKETDISAVTVTNDGLIFNATALNMGDNDSSYIEVGHDQTQLASNIDELGSKSALYTDHNVAAIEYKKAETDQILYLQDGLTRPRYNYKTNTDNLHDIAFNEDTITSFDVNEGILYAKRENTGNDGDLQVFAVGSGLELVDGILNVTNEANFTAFLFRDPQTTNWNVVTAGDRTDLYLYGIDTDYVIVSKQTGIYEDSKYTYWIDPENESVIAYVLDETDYAIGAVFDFSGSSVWMRSKNDAYTRSEVDTLLADKEDADATILKQADVIDNLTSESTIYPLSANQGRVLLDAINNIDLSEIEQEIEDLEGDVDVLDGRVDVLEEKVETLEDNTVKKQPAITLTNPTQADIDALEKYMTGDITVNFTSTNYGTRIFQGFLSDDGYTLMVNGTNSYDTTVYTFKNIKATVQLSSFRGNLTCVDCQRVELRANCTFGDFDITNSVVTVYETNTATTQISTCMLHTNAMIIVNSAFSIGQWAQGTGGRAQGYVVINGTASFEWNASSTKPEAIVIIDNRTSYDFDRDTFVRRTRIPYAAHNSPMGTVNTGKDGIITSLDFDRMDIQNHSGYMIAANLEESDYTFVQDNSQTDDTKIEHVSIAELRKIVAPKKIYPARSNPKYGYICQDSMNTRSGYHDSDSINEPNYEFDLVDKSQFNQKYLQMPSSAAFGSYRSFEIFNNCLWIGNGASNSGTYALNHINYVDSDGVRSAITLPTSQIWQNLVRFNNKLYIFAYDAIDYCVCIDKNNNVTSIALPDARQWGQRGAFAIYQSCLYVGSGAFSNTMIRITPNNTVETLTLPSENAWGIDNGMAIFENRLYVCPYNSSDHIACFNGGVTTASAVTFNRNSTWVNFCVFGGLLFIGSLGSANVQIPVIKPGGSVGYIVTANSKSFGMFTVFNNNLIINCFDSWNYAYRITAEYCVNFIMSSYAGPVSTAIQLPGSFVWGADSARVIYNNKLYLFDSSQIGSTAFCAVINPDFSVDTLDFPYQTPGVWGSAVVFKNRLVVAYFNSAAGPYCSVVDPDGNLSLLGRLNSTYNGRRGSMAVFNGRLYIGSEGSYNYMTVIE